MSNFLSGSGAHMRAAATLAAIVLLVSCGGDGSVTDPPTQPTVAAVQIDGQTTVIELTSVNATVTLTAKAMDAGNQPISGIVFTWASSDQTVATVSSSGVVKALKNGTATITASAQGKSGTRNVVVAQAASTIAITPAPIPGMAVGDSVQLTATVRDGGGSAIAGSVIAWSVSPAGAGTFSSASGATSWFKANASGTATVTAAGSGKTATANIEISPPPVSTVTIQGSGDVQLSWLNATAALSAEARNAAGEVMGGVVFSWSSSDQSVASVSSTGIVTAHRNGAATITATAGGKSGTRGVVVSQAAASVSISPSPVPSMQVGDSVLLTAAVLDAGGSAISNASVAWSVAPSGAGTFSSAASAATWFKAGAAGSATLTVASGGKTSSASVTVAPPGVSTVTILGTGNVQLASLNQTVTLSAEARDAQGQIVSGVTFTWSSSDASVASVSSAGVVTAHRNGSTTITATASGKSGTRGVVVNQVAASVTITPATLPDMQVGDSVQVTGSVKDAGGSAIADASVAWSVAPTNAGTFSSSSVQAPWFKAATAGNASITLASSGKTATAAVKINTATSSAQGSLAFNYSGSRSGSFSATGTPTWDSSGFLYGTYAGALYDTQGYDEYTVGGFVAKGGNIADGFMIVLLGVTGARSGIPICSGVYDQCPSTYPVATLGSMLFSGNWTDDGLESSDANAGWLMTSGTLNVTELTATRIKGTFSGVAVRAIDGAGSMTISNGTFDVPIVN